MPGWRRGRGRAMLRRFGGVAQLGERLLCKQEVIGSIPFTSTIRDLPDGWSTVLPSRVMGCPPAPVRGSADGTLVGACSSVG